MLDSYSNPCPVCSEKRIDKFHLYFDGAIKLYCCTTCGFVGHFPGPGNFSFPNYADFYQSEVLPTNINESYTARSPRNTQDIIRRIRKHCPPPARVLDVGCYAGVFMNKLKEAGYSAEGVEAVKAIAAYATEETGLPIHTGLYSKTMFGPEVFDVIAFLNVFHHMPDPMGTLAAASYHLRPGGLIVIDVPSLQNPVMLLYSLTRMQAIPLRFPAWSAINNLQIVAYYRPRSLSRVLAQAGFNLTEMTTGRYSLKYFASSALLSYGLKWIDIFCQRLQIGTILAIARKR